MFFVLNMIMEFNFQSRDINHIQKITTDMKHCFHNMPNIESAFNSLILKHRMLPTHTCVVFPYKTKMALGTCGICNKAYNVKNLLTKLNRCEHTFHKTCIVNWLIHNNQRCFSCDKHILKLL